MWLQNPHPKLLPPCSPTVQLCLSDPRAAEATLKESDLKMLGEPDGKHSEIWKGFLLGHFIKEAVIWLPVPGELKGCHVPRLNLGIKCEIPQTLLTKAISRINIH